MIIDTINTNAKWLQYYNHDNDNSEDLTLIKSLQL